MLISFFFCPADHVPDWQPRMLLLFFSNLPIGPQTYPVIYVVANPVRGLLDRKRSEEHLQSSDESTRNEKTKKSYWVCG